MAAQEYYQSFQQHPPQGAPPPYTATSPLPQNGRPSLAPAQSPYNYSPQPNSFAQHQFLQLPGQGQPSPQSWSLQPGSSYTPPVPYQGGPQRYSPATQGYPLIPSRSKSEPPENRRPSVDLYSSRKHHSHSRSQSRSRSRSQSREYSSRSRSRSRHHSHHRKRSHSDRDTFIGAGAGGLIGDALLPGLGTLFGALAGGVGGHEYAHRKESRSHSDSGYRDGITVRSGWIRR